MSTTAVFLSSNTQQILDSAWSNPTIDRLQPVVLSTRLSLPGIKT